LDHGYKKFLQDISITFLTSIVNVIIAFPISIILGRYLGVGELGLYRMVTTIYGVCILFATMGIPASVIKYVAEFQKNNDQVTRIISSSIYISILLGIISFLIIFLSSNIIGNFFNMTELPLLIRTISIVFPFSVTCSTMLAILNGFRDMKIYSLISVSQNILMLLITIIFILLGYGVVGVVNGIIISNICIFIYLLWKFRNYFTKISSFQIINNSKILLNFGIKTVIGNSVILINYYADTLMIGYFLTAEAVGVYSVAVILSQFLWLIPDSIQKITYPIISEYHGKKRNEEINQIVTKTMRYTTCILITIGIIALIYSKYAIELIYGDSFGESIKPFRILLIGTIIFGVVKSISSVFAAIGRTDLFAKIPIISAIINVLLNFLLIPIYGITGAAIATATSLCVYSAIMVYYMKKLLRVSFDINWYTKTLVLTAVLIIINDITMGISRIHVPKMIIAFLEIILIWSYLLTSEEKKYLYDAAYKSKQAVCQFFCKIKDTYM